MKSMQQMQNEMLAKCKFDGSYPRPVHMGMGIIALAHSQDEEARLRKSADTSLFAAAVAIIALAVGALGFMIFASI